MIYEKRFYKNIKDFNNEADSFVIVWETKENTLQIDAPISGKLVYCLGYPHKTFEVPDGIEIIGRSIFEKGEWECWGTEITTLVIPSSVKSIEEGAFIGSGIKKIRIDSDSNAGTITKKALYTKDGKTLLWVLEGNENDEYIVPEGVVRIGLASFENVSTLVLPDSVKEIAYDDDYDYLFEHITIKAPTGSYAISFAKEHEIEYEECLYKDLKAKSGSKSKENKKIENSTEEFVIENGTLLKYNGNGGNVQIPSHVTNIGDSSFRGCKALKSITMPDTLTSIGRWAFSGCENLDFVTLSSNLVSIDDFAFYNCCALNKIVLPNTLTAIGEHVFSGCSGFTTIDIPSSVVKISGCSFGGCGNIKDINVDENNRYYKSVDGVLYSKNGTILYKYPAGKANTNFVIPSEVRHIGENAFGGCQNLLNITIPNAVEDIGDAAFYGCSNLQEIVLPGGLSSIENSMFGGCEHLAQIVIPKDVSSIGENAFSNCKSLKQIILPDKITSIGDEAFSWCTSLEHIDMPPKITCLKSRTFSSCFKLESVTIPDGVIKISKDAFDWCGKQLTLKGSQGSYTEKYAIKNNIKFEVV